MSKYYYLGDTIRARRSAVVNVLARIKIGWSNFRDFLTLVTTRNLPLGAKVRLYSACLRGLMQYGSGQWSVKEEYVITLWRYSARMVRYVNVFRLEYRIAATELNATDDKTTVMFYFEIF